MSKTMLAMMLGMGLALPVAAQEAAPAAAPTEEQKTVEQVLGEFRDESRNQEADVLAKGLKMTAEEASVFWPAFERYQAERQEIVDGQIAATSAYAEHYLSDSDEHAVAYVNALLERDQKIHDLRVRYLAEFTRILGPGRAARAVHIIRRLGLAGQARLASAIPLVR